MNEEAAEELTPGTMLGDYRVESRVGQGGMATVYSAIHPLIGKKAAIKVMSRRLCADATALERFVAEARAVNQIGHPNIVDIFTFGNLPDGRRYIVMEWLAGETLQARINRGRLPLAEAIPILLQTADALGAAHETGIVHRDLKPDNIFLVPVRGTRTLVKLLDFGIAKLQSDESGGMSVAKTKTGLFVGTPTHISPEQARGRKVDAKTDLYALGVCAFQMATGRLPFDAPDAIDVITMHLHRPPPLPRTFWPEIPPAFEALILSLLAKDPAQRPTLEDVLPRLRDIADEVGAGTQLVGESAGVSGQWPRQRTPKPSGPVPILPVLRMTGDALPVQPSGAMPPSVSMTGEGPLTPLVAQPGDAIPVGVGPPPPIAAMVGAGEAQIPSFTSDGIPILVDAGSAANKLAPNGAGAAADSASDLGIAARWSPRSLIAVGGGLAAVVVVVVVILALRGPSSKPGPTPPPNVATTTTAPTPTPAPAPPAPTPTAAPAPAPAGEITLTVNVASQVLLDGKSVAESVRKLSIPVAPGAHELEISAPGYQTVTPHVTVDSGRTLRLPVRLSHAKRGSIGKAPSSGSQTSPTTTTKPGTTTPATPGNKPANREYMLDPFGEGAK